MLILFPQLTPTQRKRVRATNEDIPFKRLKLASEEGSSIDVCLWREHAELNLYRGECVRLLNFTVSDTFGPEGQNVPALTNKSSKAIVEVIKYKNNTMFNTLIYGHKQTSNQLLQVLILLKMISN